VIILAIALSALLVSWSLVRAGGELIPSTADASDLQARGISMYVPFEGSLDAQYARGRATAIEPYFEPFYRGQSMAYQPGRHGQCVTGQPLCLVYDPRRNFSPDRGAVSFWFKPQQGDQWTYFQVVAREVGVGPNSRRQMDLYYATFLFGTSPVLRRGFHRALIRPVLEPIDLTFTLEELDPDAWYHLVWTWDNTQGMRLFLDGEKLCDNWGTVSWVQMMTPGIVKLKSMRACDELLLFSRPLSEAEALGLYRGELPGPRPDALEYRIPPELERDMAHAYGLDQDTDYPVVLPDEPLLIAPLQFIQATDSRRPMHFCLDGNRASCWPNSHIEIVNTDRLNIDYGDTVQANHFRVLADGTRFAVHTGKADAPIWVDEVRPERDGWEDKLVRRCWLPEPVAFDTLVLDRKGNRIGEFAAYDIRPGTLASPADQRLDLQPTGVRDIRDLDHEGGVFQLYHNHASQAVMVGSNATGATGFAIPDGAPDDADQDSVSQVAAADPTPSSAGGSDTYQPDPLLACAPLVPFHLVTEPVPEQAGVAGVGLELAMQRPVNRNEEILRVRIPDPIAQERDLFSVDLKLRFDTRASPTQLFSIHVDLRDVVLNADRRLWVWLVSRSGSALDLTRTRMTLHIVPVAQAAEQMVPDVMRLIQHTYQYSSEPHPWTRAFKWPGDERYYYWWSEWAPLVNLVRHGLASDDPVVGAYWHVLRPATHPSYAEYVDYSRNRDLRDLPYTRFPEPVVPNPAKAPEWALYQRELLEIMLSIPQWWHDHRLVEQTGIVNGYGDDTQLTGESFWLYFCTGDARMRRMLRAVAEGTWKHAGFYRGYPSRTNDVGHNAEEVVGAWPLLILSEYGDPRYVEMTMETLSLLDFVTTRTARGHRHFRSWYYSATEVVTDGDMGVDNFGNSQFTILGHMLSWYNRNPKLTQFYKDWSDAWLDDFARSRELGMTEPISVRMPADEPIVGVYHRSYTMPLQYYITGLLTGDEQYCARALRNDDGFFPEHHGKYGVGMLARDFAFGRHRLREKRFADTPTMARPRRAFGQYFVSGDKQILADHYRAQVRDYRQGRHYLYTEGQPSTDRLWGLNDESMYLAYLGGLPAGHRTTSNWPGLALSYADAGTDLASLVLENRRDDLQVLIHNFEPSRSHVEMVVWQLEPGLYELTVGPDADGDDAPDHILHSESVSVRRGTRLQVPLPYGQLQMARLRQLEPRPEPEFLPDLALGPHDVRYDADLESLQITIHNIGSRDVGSYAVRILDRAGRLIAEESMPPLPAPVDLVPQTALVRVPLEHPRLLGAARVELVPAEPEVEITTNNNALSLRPLIGVSK